MSPFPPVLLLAALVFGACAPPEEPEPRTPALESLRAPRYDPRFGLRYWTGRLEQRETDPEWAQALEFCRDRDPSRYPNCRTVQILEMASKIPGFGEEVRP